MADAKDKIVMHGGGIVTVGGKIIMGPCDPVEYYVRLMVGNELMDDWWWRVGREKPTKWEGNPNAVGNYYYPVFSDFTPIDVKDHIDKGVDGSHKYNYVTQNTGESPLGLAKGIYDAGYDYGFPSVSLMKETVFLFDWVESEGPSSRRAIAHKFNTRQRVGDPEGSLDVGTYVLQFDLAIEYKSHSVADDQWYNYEPMHRESTNMMFGGCYAFFKFVISKAGKDEEGVGGSPFKIDVPGFGNWSKGIIVGGASDSNVVMDIGGAPHLEVVKIGKDKDGNSVEEVVWQSE